MSSDTSLRVALMSNATFSLLAALTFLGFPETVSAWTGVRVPGLVQIIGGGLIVFALDLFHQATRRRLLTWRALYASIADFTWVLGSLVLVALFSHLLSAAGVLLVLAVAAAVLAFGCWQLCAIDRVHRTGQPGEYRHCVLIAADAPAEKLWPVISNFADIKHFAVNLRSSVVQGGKAPGLGAIRTCEDHTGKRWSEECIAFAADSGYEMRFMCEAPDFPFPVSAMRGGWQLTSQEYGAQILVWWELIPKGRLLAPLLLPLFAYQADRDFPAIIRRMVVRATGARPDDSTDHKPACVRLIPDFC